MLQTRPPIIVILGHVDHGKTTLLDYLRQSHVAAREVGGITQHIRSFQLKTAAGKLLTFIDTPGHAAFVSMRERGSRVADIALLIVAGNDGVMPQTKEAAAAILAAKIPYLVVITKSDLPEADPDRVKTQLTELGIVVEDFGGPVPAAVVSAKTGAGIPQLLDTINLLSELHPPQADPDGQLAAVVIESRLDSKKGPLAEVIVKNGTLTTGVSLFTSALVGRVRALLNSDAQNLPSALPSTPVEILGLTSVPPVGTVISDHPLTVSSPVAVPLPVSKPGSLNIILRADVVGSLEAITALLDPQITVLSSATGDVSENDILLARPSDAQVLAFNVKIPGSVAKLAEIEAVPVHSFRIIYELSDYLDQLLHPAVTEVILGQAVISAEFKIGPDRIAGCRVQDGQLDRGGEVRLERGSQVIGTSKLKSLQIGKTAADRVKAGQEFGATLSPYLDFKVGDYIIAIAHHGSS